MRIFGLDPGSLYTGYGLIDRHGSSLEPVAYGRIALGRGLPLAERLVRLSHEVRALIARFEPQVSVMEALYRGVNSRSLIVLAQARGALLLTLANAGLDTHEYSPAEIKMAVAGHGGADKDQVGHMVKLILRCQDASLAADASDALAVAICYAQRLRLDRLGGHLGGSRRRR